LLSSTCGVLYNAFAIILSLQISMPNNGSQHLYFIKELPLSMIQIQIQGTTKRVQRSGTR